MRPFVAVTTTIGLGGSRQVPRVCLNAAYLSAVAHAGATGIPLTPAHDGVSVRQLVDHCHGLVLTGGDDLDPARYGAQIHPATSLPNPARDAMEFAALEAALERGMPVLAICRGMQVLNVALGGTLIQDIPSERGGDILHEQAAPVGRGWHHATVLQGSGLHRVFGASELFINSFHHQAVDRLGAGLRATVWAEDGIVEGVETTEYPWVYGVQWHPERGQADTPADNQRDPDRRLFAAFTRAAEAFAREREALPAL